MYDNSRQRSAVLPIVLGTVGSVLACLLVRRVREDRAAARGGEHGPPAHRPGSANRSRPARRSARERRR